ncbi:putative lipoprotein [Pseudomonas fluorescens]|uniref:Putative lipoprotein n=1 Tax=Pseudomonas fluorescens TaxID=294 RepID=A0A0N8NY11_PSEFL|nr:putative lipoprotein [Pseudomonas fluorescens]
MPVSRSAQPVGAGLPAKASCQSPWLLAGTPLSLASQLPQVLHTLSKRRDSEGGGLADQAGRALSGGRAE